ncbi:transglutaminase-like cysteine peptidase [Pelomonas sp. CA6]|uniref:transglutaminase-like cysteine peptidase n=1 Tax=Pelomonas sp. CA6 TaxID=2907999 RepID=UPI001F4BE192|nr:transglutaminase-like cysteine peptidase [Pelomonas sp. CA6]MCH7343871.1 transglutaminase-like cysteine peptidase [Pelomonas sp. CA6]
MRSLSSRSLRCFLACALTLQVTLAPAWQAERVLESAGRMSPRVLTQARALVQLVERHSGAADEARLKAANAFFNQRIAFMDDMQVWGRVDYWASPLEALDKGQGDCEDYAIAKYFTLLAMGVPEARLRMVYVRAMFQGRPQAHMVLAYYAEPQAEPLVLDNLDPEIKPASQRGDLQPVFSFNTEGLWQGVGSTSAGDPMRRLVQWRELLAKVRAEGF